MLGADNPGERPAAGAEDPAAWDAALEDGGAGVDDPVAAVGAVAEGRDPSCPPVLGDRWTGGELGVAVDETGASGSSSCEPEEDPGVR